MRTRPAWSNDPAPILAPDLGEELDRLRRLLARNLLEAFVEPARVRLLRLGERLEPLGELGEALLTRGLGHAWYICVYSYVSPATADLRFFSVLPIGSSVTGSPTSFRKSRCPKAWPVSASAVSLKRPAMSGNPSMSATRAK